MKHTLHRAKIIATIGPSTRSVDMIARLIEAGVNAFRLNFSHAVIADHEQSIKNIRKVSLEMNRPVAILQDLGGPKLRIGEIAAGKPVILKKGDIVSITSRRVMGNARCFSTNAPQIVENVKVGHHLRINDGIIDLAVRAKDGKTLECEVIAGGELSSRKGINLPHTKLDLPSLTKKDLRDLDFGIAQGVDCIALSFVRQAKDIKQLKNVLKNKEVRVPVIAKIEKPEAIENLDEILDLCDGAMVARGDLAIETAVAAVPIYQKEIIAKCNKRGIMVITATQMLESMVKNVLPTRAEASDVANAIFDGTDCVMLSAETSVGNYPVEAVRTMRTIITAAEESALAKHEFRISYAKGRAVYPAIAHSACLAADELRAKAIVVFTMTGLTARVVASTRPATRIVAFSSNEAVLRELSLVWGVTALKLDFIPNTDRMYATGKQQLLQNKIVRRGDTIVVLAGVTPMPAGSNMLNIMKV
jgi:pyruvate kinase